MKKFYLLILLFLGVNVSAQWVSIPDTNFGTWLSSNGFSSCLQGNNSTGWQMDTTCPNVVNRTSVFCASAGISDLTGITYFNNLDTLVCWNNSIDSLPILPNSLTYFDCGVNDLDSLTFLPDSLNVLNCRANYNLTVLSNLPPKLIKLDCSSTSLISYPPIPNSVKILMIESVHTSFPVFPDSLKELYCGNSNHITLPALPISLTLLNCRYNNLSSLPVLPSSLQKLYCDNNELTTLPQLPNSLEWIDCIDNHITSLPALPDSLVYISCWTNNLTSLPTLPNLLEELLCNNNQLTTLPTLPSSLKRLECGHNSLANLPLLPVSLNRLGCGFNQLTSLPPLPNILTYLNCQSNELTHLPVLPDSMYILYCESNPLACLPTLNRIVDFHFAINNLTCTPNYGNITSSQPNILSLPLCDSINNPNSCQMFSSTTKLELQTLTFRLSPNPATTYTTITIDEALLNSTATITDITGRVMMAVELATTNLQLETSRFESGVYFITLQHPNGTNATRKLVVSR